VCGQALRLLDIGLLRALVPAAQQHHQRLLTLAVIHPVTGAIINPQFRYPAVQMAAIPRIAQRQSADAGLNPRLRLPIPQRVKSGIKRSGGMDVKHASIIFDNLPLVNRETLTSLTDWSLP